MRSANFCTRLFVWLHSSPFLRELFKTIEVRPPSQALSLFPFSIPHQSQLHAAQGIRLQGFTIKNQQG
jgi:hypothetical protein